MNAYRHRLAHFISACLTIDTSCCRSDSGLLAWKSDGAVNGDTSMMDPSIQNRGNTIRSNEYKVKASSDYMQLTETKFEETVSERRWLF